MKVFLIILNLVLFFHPQIFAAQNLTRQKILIAIDGFSYNALRAAQLRGLFTEYKNGGAHIAPFPSMTDLSWSKITKTAKLFGQIGRIRSVEATYFDESTQTVQGDPRDYYRRLAFPKYYMGAFQTYFNPYLESLVYFPTEEIPKMEIKYIVDDLLTKTPSPIWTAYIGSVDSTAHTQKNRLFPVLETLDQELKRLINELKQKNIIADIILVSDHGNRGQFSEGSADETELVPYEIAQVVKTAGMNFTQKIEKNGDVAIPLLALGSWAPIYVHNPEQKFRLINSLKSSTGFDSLTYIKTRTKTYLDIAFLTATESATIRYDSNKKLYYYYPHLGNPLNLPAEWHSTSVKAIGISSNKVLELSYDLNYPDAIYRLVDAASNEDFDYPDLILNIKDGYFIKGPIDSPVKMFRTHGSLSKNSSLGIFVSNHLKLPGSIRSADLLSAVGVTPEYLFGETYKKHILKPGQVFDQLRTSDGRGVETNANDYSTDRLFKIITRFISDSRSFFVIDEIDSLLKAFKENPFSSGKNSGELSSQFDLQRFDAKSLLSTEDIGHLTDAVIQSGDIEKLKNDPRVLSIKDKIQSQFANENPAQQNPQSFIDSITKFIMPSKRIAMKMYQMPYLLESALTVQELPYVPDVRSKEFISDWMLYRRQMITSQKSLIKKFTENNRVETEDLSYEVPNTWASRLFDEVFKENRLEEKIYPTQLSKLYNRQLKPETTIVYVPGIYNGIFDKEIFSLAINALKEEYGLRVISPPVWSTCSTNVNGKIIIDFLKQDQKNQIEKGLNKPNYLILAYSKGGADTLNGFTQDPDFIAKNVLGLVTIASGIHGSSILDKTDLPFELVSLLVENSGPTICKDQEKAGPSVNPSAMQKFWRTNERKLIGLTRYFSISFISTPEKSHIFMRATKAIGQFNEVNDGVITLSSSHFPESIQAIDLGVIEADHLAGILSSRFPQKAFFKAIISTLAELDIDDLKNNFKLNSDIILAWNKVIKNRSFVSLSEDEEQPSKYKLSKTSFLQNNAILPTRTETTIDDTAQLNKLLVPRLTDPASLYDTQVKLPQSQFQYDPYQALDVAKLSNIMQNIRVSPMAPTLFKDGVQIEFKHQSTIHFRMDHQFSWESRTPTGMDDNQETGWEKSEFQGEKDWAVLRSKNNSIRLTTIAYRFKPKDFPLFELKAAVTKGVKDADPVKGKSGIDDSALQVWLSVREKNMTGDRTVIDPKKDKIVLFGYYWGDPIKGESRKPGDIFEDWYSNKNVIVATLPEAKMLLLNTNEQIGVAQVFKRNLVEDLRRAFPDRNVEEMEIVAITIQHDSNDAKDSSEAYFKYLKFMPTQK